MKEKKHIKTIVLIICLLVVTISGIYVLNMRNKDDADLVSMENGEAKDTDDNTQLNDTHEAFYYVDNMIAEDADAQIIAKYNSQPTKLCYDSKDDKLSLFSLETQEIVFDIPNSEMVEGAKYWIDKNNIFWTVGCDIEGEKVLVKSYNETGQQIDEIELKDYKGYIEDNSEGSFYISVREFKTDDAFIYVLASSFKQPALHVYTKEGELKYFYEQISSMDIDGNGNFLIAVTVSEEFPLQGFLKISADTGEELYRSETDNIDKIRYDADKDVIYCLHAGKTNEVKIYRGDDGVLLESVYNFANGEIDSFEKYRIEDFQVDDDGNFYTSFWQNFGSPHMFYAYEKIMGAPEERAITLTIEAPYRSDFIAEAIMRYEKKYPTEKIEYNYAYDSRDNYTSNYEIYNQKLHLNILTGDIGDIVQVGDWAINYLDFAKTDAFMDLKPYIIKDKNYNNLNKNAIHALEIDDSIMVLPINTYNSFVEVNEKLAEELGLDLDFEKLSWKEALNIVKIIEEKAPDTYLFYVGGSLYKAIFSAEVIESNIHDLIDFENKSVNLNQEWFKDLIKDLKESLKNKNFAKTDGEFTISDTLYGCLFTLRTHYNGVGYRDLLWRFCEYNKQGKSAYVPMFTGEKNNNRSAYSDEMYAINNRSTRKDTAWKFLSFLLEEDINGLRSLNYTPINNMSFKRVVDKAERDEGIRSIEKNSKEYNDIKRFEKYMENISNSVDYLYNMDRLRSDIQIPVIDYLDDKITLEEAINRSEENLIIRLNE